MDNRDHERSFKVQGFTLVELLVVITILGILIALAVPNFMRAKQKVLEAQAKSNIHAIQESLERFASDNDGYYPAYIWGGSVTSWCWDTATNAGLRAGCATQRKVSLAGPDLNRVLDPLIRYGYRDSYPRNPFITTSQALCGPTANDPRFGCPIQAESDSIMGNTMIDPNVPDSGFGPVTVIGYGGRINNIFFAGDDQQGTIDWVPGEFFYRSWSSRRDRPYCANTAVAARFAAPWPHTADAGFLAGQAAARPNCESDAKADYYVLGVYGASLTQGADFVCDPIPPNPGAPGQGPGCDYNGRGNPPDPPPALSDHYYGEPGGFNNQYFDSLPNVVFFDYWDTDNDGRYNQPPPPVGAGPDPGESDTLPLEEKSKHARSGYGQNDGIPDGIVAAFATGSPISTQK
ncbi:MAG: type II secretion system protein [bacterium]